MRRRRYGVAVNGGDCAHHTPAVLLVDWENLRCSLLRERYVASPKTVLDALLRAIPGAMKSWAAERGRSSGHTGEVERVELHFPAGWEFGLDRHLLRAEHVQLVSPDSGDKNMADMEMALSSLDAYYEAARAGCLLFVSNDADVARAAQLFASRSLIAHRTQTCAAVLVWGSKYDGKAVAVARVQLRPAMDWDGGLSGYQLKRHVWGRWDRLAWTLVNAARKIPEDRRAQLSHPVLDGLLDKSQWEFETRGLESKSDLGQWPQWRARRKEEWKETLTAQRHALSDLELIDSVVASLWRLKWGEPFSHDETVSHIQSYVAGAEEAHSVFGALLLSGLVRQTGPNAYEVPRPWAEGLLYPVRRAILRLRIRRGRAPDKTLATGHAGSRPTITRGVRDPVPKPDHYRDDDQDSWRLTRAALQNFKTAEVDKDHVWTLRRGWLVEHTISAARQVRMEVLGHDPVWACQMVQPAIKPSQMPASRWLRCLTDAAVLRINRAEGHWEKGEQWEALD